MRCLLSANFARLWKSRFFWMMETAVVLFGAIIYALTAINARSFGAAWAMARANANFFLVLMVMGPALAVFIGFYIGTEYTDGTIRNKLYVGHTRRAIYLANLAICATVGLLFLLTPMLCACTVGLLFVGKEVLFLHQPLGCLLCAALITMTYAAVFSLVAMLDTNKARGLVISLLLSMAMLLAGLMVFSRLQSPPTVNQIVMSEAGSYELIEGIPNSRYLSGWMRSLYQALDMILPSSQMMHLVAAQGTVTFWMPLCSLCLIAVLTGSGIGLFEKKDLR